MKYLSGKFQNSIPSEFIFNKDYYGLRCGDHVVIESYDSNIFEIIYLNGILYKSPSTANFASQRYFFSTLSVGSDITEMSLEKFYTLKAFI